jgi:hypothetical protein
MAQPDDGRGNLYEQVLEYAKREMDEAASKMDEIKQSLELLEARVEAAKAVYQAVASRLNLEDEADGPGFQASFPDVPAHVPEPPLSSQPLPAPVSAPAESPAEVAPPNPVSENGSSSPDSKNPISDLDLIRQHLAGKAQENDTSEPPAAPPAPAPAVPMAPPAAPVSAPVEAAPEAEAPVRGTPPLAKPPTADEDDSFSMKLIRQHLEQKAKEQDTPSDASSASDSAPVEPAPPLQMAAIVQDSPSVPDTPSAPEGPAAGGSGLSEADRELIGAYLRSKQN